MLLRPHITCGTHAHALAIALSANLLPGDELLSPVGKPYDTLEEVIGIRESAINIISGQFVLLVLKLGYFTNTTYGYIKWSKYIKQSKIEDKTLL